MKNKNNLLPLIISFLFITLSSVPTVYAQKISGKIIDKTTSKPIQGVTVEILNKTDSNKWNLTTNTQGIFESNTLKNGSYTIRVNYIGYKNDSKEVALLNSNYSSIFYLEPSEIQIEEVEITSSQPLVLKGDTMEFDAKNYATRSFADADELVAQIPGVLIDEEGNVSAHGEQVTRIIVDGKEFFSSDPRIALKTLPAEIIAKIQLIDEKSEQAKFSGFDDGKRNKVINIVTKPDRRQGYFGKANAGKGNGDKFGTSFSVNSFDNDKKFAVNLMANNINETNFAEQGRGGIRRGNNNTERGLSDTYAGAANFTNTYFDKKMELSADYNFRSLGTFTNTNSEIEYLTERQANQFRSQNQLADNLNKEHKFNSRIKWNIDTTNRIDFSPRLTISGRDVESSSISQTSLNKDRPINNSNRSGSNSNNNFDIGASLTYMHRFKKKGRTASVNISANKSSNDANGLNMAINTYYRNANLNRIDTNNNQSITEGYGSGFNSRLSFTENISRYGRLQANYGFRNTASYSNKETFEFLAETGQLGELRDRLSNEFRNDYNYHSAGLSYVYNKKDSLRLQFGLNYQHGVRINNRVVPIHLETKADFSSLLPEFTARYRFSKDRFIELNYNTQTNTPSINQLQDFVNNQNELRITNGNPNLDQEYAHTLKLQYKDINKQSGRSLTTNVNFEYINDKIVNKILMTDTSIILFDDILLGAGGQFTSPINVNGAYSARIFNSYSLPIKSLKTNFNSNSRLFFNKDIAQLNEELFENQTFGFGQTIGLNSNFSKKYIVGLTYNIDVRFIENPISQVSKYEIYTHRISSSFSLEILKNFVVSSNFMYLYNSGLMGNPGIKTNLLNASIGYKLFKRKEGEIAIKGFDLLNDAQNISRRVNENNISDITSNTLNRYFLMSFTYNLRKFGLNNRKANPRGKH